MNDLQCLPSRFFERIAKTYRHEKWADMLRPLLETWYSCAQQLGDVELSVRLLVEMLGHGSDDEETVQESLLAVLLVMTFSRLIHSLL